MTPLSVKTLRAMALNAGAVAFGIAKCDQVDEAVINHFQNWLRHGCHGSMDYMERNGDIRLDPAKLLDGAKSIICLAFPYRQKVHHPNISDYALGQDYHYVLKERAKPLCLKLAEMGAESRVCVDSAPIFERYWAQKAGLGFIGLNRQLIVPEVGSGVFLCEIITTLELELDTPNDQKCLECGKCFRACPGGALSAQGLDARKCLSYLTLEHKGEFTSDTPPLGAYIAGCDICQRVCPHNTTDACPVLEEFTPNEALMALGKADFEAMTSGPWRRLTQNSPLSRISLKNLRRNTTSD